MINCKKGVIEYKTVKLKMIGSSHFEPGQTKWRTKINTYISIQYNYFIKKQIAKLTNNY